MTTSRRGARAQIERLLTPEEIEKVLGVDKWVYLCVAPNRWGKGFSPAEAQRATLKSARDPYVIIACADPWVYVDDMGLIIYTPRDPQNPRAHTEYVKIEERKPKRGDRA